MLAKIESLPEWLAGAADRNTGTLWQVVKAYRANLRQGTVGVKTRTMVRSTGKKPYAQKHMGRARRGSFVSPLHVGGGVAHGPKARDYRQAIPKKMGRLAMQIALAKCIKSGSVYTADIKVESGKTKEAAAYLNEIHSGLGKVVVCLGSNDTNAIRAFRNVRGVVLKSPAQINALDLILARNVVFGNDAWKLVEARVQKLQK